MPRYPRVVCLVLAVTAGLSVAAGGFRPPREVQAQSVTGACLNPPGYVGSPDCVDLTFDACKQAWGGIDVYAAGKFFAGTCVEWRRQGETGRCVTYSPSYSCFAASRAQCETDERRNAGYFFTIGGTCPATAPTTQPTTPPAASAASDALTFKPELTIPGLLEGVWNISDTTIAEYIRVIFVAFVWAVGILATVMVVYGGIKWVAAAGNPGRINDARGIINDAIIGVLIALVSVVLLNTINPRLTSFRGIGLSYIDKELASYLNNLLTSVGELPRCTKKLVAGEPSKACSGPTAGAGENGAVDYGCIDLNAVIQYVARKDKDLDAFAIKAIIAIESPKTTQGQPFSGPEGKTDNGQPGPGYGLGQFKVSTLVEVLKKVNPGGLPPGCRTATVTDPATCTHEEVYDCDGKHISQSCKAWLDKRTAGKMGTGISGMQAQVQMISDYYGQQLLNQSCVQKNLLLAAAAYNQGLGGASDSFCSTTFLKDRSKVEQIRANAKNYMAEFKQAYATACANGR
ncbi:MAG: pilin [Patescibacteria group bacterium]